MRRGPFIPTSTTSAFIHLDTTLPHSTISTVPHHAARSIQPNHNLRFGGPEPDPEHVECIPESVWQAARSQDPLPLRHVRDGLLCGQRRAVAVSRVRRADDEEDGDESADDIEDPDADVEARKGYGVTTEG
ncbi:hypothetical protein AC578_10920 [Pseudocercospora eumusae]|uniref:Uncharacterized protein n=1 Tax=Pseudocercospora eumusae TaxID=321146 RepID=A0A139GVL8_9PEZI|nr:hypothetical protein AC578_10920 [Pseudocercospora eumusae]